ncbi:hypothetical protein WNY81_20325 [Shewanella frigidimarina]|uniref:hypothetical protein n=1 Tax=Shewanella TaxID=22 RepID=UPI00316DD6C6
MKNALPLIVELPKIISTVGWKWETFSPHDQDLKEFWIGTDLNGNRWLTKLRGSFYAYREIVFAHIAQSMGISCQSSTYMVLDSESATLLDGQAGDVHSAHWFIEEHSIEPCSDSCPYHQLMVTPICTIEDLYLINIPNILDWPKSEFLAYILGANEISDRLFTKNHELVIIDSEQMFSTNHHDFNTLKWWFNHDKTPSSTGKNMVKEICAKFASLDITDIKKALTVPAGITIPKHKLKRVSSIIWDSYEYAKKYS